MKETDHGLIDCLPSYPGLVSGVTFRQSTLQAYLDTLGLSDLPVVGMNQTHSNQVKWAGAQADSETELPDTDACLSDQKNIILKVRTADCLPIMLFHPSPIIGVIHAGRKGTETGILTKTLTQIKTKMGPDLTDLQVWFGPAICKACYQINRETNQHYDLITQNKIQLNTALQAHQFSLHESNQCTSCQLNQYFSYRKEGAKTGRIYSFITLSSS